MTPELIQKLQHLLVIIVPLILFVGLFMIMEKNRKRKESLVSNDSSSSVKKNLHS